MVTTAPPANDTFFSACPTKNASHLPSGEKKGFKAPSVPAITALSGFVQQTAAKRPTADCPVHDARAVGRDGKRWLLNAKIERFGERNRRANERT